MTEYDHEILKVLPEEFLLIFTNTHENINDNLIINECFHNAFFIFVTLIFFLILTNNICISKNEF